MKTRKLLAAWIDIKERNAPGFVYAVIAFVYVILGGRVTLWMLAFTSDVLKNIHMFECIFFFAIAWDSIVSTHAYSIFSLFGNL